MVVSALFLYPHHSFSFRHVYPPVSSSSRIYPKTPTLRKTFTPRKRYCPMLSRLRHPSPIRSHTAPPTAYRSMPTLPYPILSYPALPPR